MKRFPAALATTIALALSPMDAAAQACIGNATSDGAWGAQGIAGLFSYDLPEDVTGYDVGAEGTANLAGPLGATAAYIMRMPESGDLQIHIARGGLTLQVPEDLMPLAIPLAICAYGGAGVSSSTQESSQSDFTSVAFPVGVGIGVPLRISPQLTLYPAVTPQYIFANVEGEVIGFPIEESDDGFAIEVGSGFRYGSIIGSASVFISTLSAALGAPPYGSEGFAVKLGVEFE